VASILAQVGGDSVRAGGLTEDGRFDRVGLDGFSSFPNGRDMVDVDLEPLRLHLPRHSESFYFSTPQAALMEGRTCAVTCLQVF
jgi:hypothetical protein